MIGMSETLLYLVIAAVTAVYAVTLWYLRKYAKSVLDAFVAEKTYYLEKVLPLLKSSADFVCNETEYDRLCRYLKELHAILKEAYDLNKLLEGSGPGEFVSKFRGGSK